MDIPRPDVAAKKRKKRIITISAMALGVILVTIGFSRLKPAVPSVDRSTVWIDTVKRGPMVRQVRGLGTLVPEDIRWIAASTEGRVEKIIVRPGTHVEPDTVILEMSSPELEQSGSRRRVYSRQAAEAELTTLRATLQRELLDQESTTARVHSEYRTGENGAADQRSAGEEWPRCRVGLQDLEGEGSGAGESRRDRAKAP